MTEETATIGLHSSHDFSRPQQTDPRQWKQFIISQLSLKMAICVYSGLLLPADYRKLELIPTFFGWFLNATTTKKLLETTRHGKRPITE